ncbi:helix-turn-helix domain-containing protein [Micromonospora sp. NPDC049903]|uniref:helix-turn-helix domain-containing protein n=1 Tax=Micromonospora sp. NPDC049903 TaxID=3364276 RepID=UPI0037B255B5
MGRDAVPIGRRVAYLRVQRKLSQQTFADRLGKSKSWVDKVERGVRSLERVSVIRDIATVLRVDAATLLGSDSRSTEAAERSGGVARIRAALSTYDMVLRHSGARETMPPARLGYEIEHAWTTYQHARYPQLTELLPALLSEVHHAQIQAPDACRIAMVEAYRLTAALLVKLDEASLAWLAADRAVAVASDDPVLLACAAVQLGQVLRGSARAKSVMLAAAYQIAPPDLDAGSPQELSLCGALLVQAALIAATAGDDRAAADLLEEAAEMATRIGDRHDHHRTAFGPTTVELARVAAAIELGDATEAISRHRKAIGMDGWRWLPVEHRAAHLIDAARAYFHADDPANAARLLVQADTIAPAEIRHRPMPRTLVADVARTADTTASISQLALTIGAI